MSRLSTNVHEIFTQGLVNVLNGIQIFTTTDFIKIDAKIIENATTLSFREILQIKNDFIKKFAPKPVNGFSYYKNILQNSAILPTGIKSLDNLLNGGLITGNIYELSGLPASGKTLLSQTIAKQIIQNFKQKIYYLDSKNNFSPKKFKEILNSENFLQQMDYLLIKKLTNKYDLINSLFSIKKELDNGLNSRLIIIDSLAILMMDFQDHTENNNILSHLANIMNYLAKKHNVVFFVVNLLTLWRESNDFDSHDLMKKKISCGKFWATVPNVKLSMEKILDNKCKISVIETLNCCSDEVVEVTVSNIGISE